MRSQNEVGTKHLPENWVELRILSIQIFFEEVGGPLDLGDVPDPPLEGVGAIYRGGLVQLGLGQRRWRHLALPPLVVASRNVEARLEVSVARREVGRRGRGGLRGINDLTLEVELVM